MSPEPRFLAERSVPVVTGPALDEAIDALASAPSGVTPRPPAFEELGLDAGLVRYGADVLLPEREVTLTFERVADRAMVWVDGVWIGTVTGSGSLAVRGEGRVARLTVLVENLGRVNYGPGLGERKGLLGGVLVERRLVQGWSAEAVDLSEADAAVLASPSQAGGPAEAGVATASLEVDEPADTHLALPGFGKGFVWINGFLLGRYWNIGPQQTLYVPAPLLRAGVNEVVVLELEHRGDRIELRRSPELGPPEQYIEEF